MRWISLLLSLPLLAPPAWGAQKTEPPPQVIHRDRVAAGETVRAATGRAVADLYAQIATLPIHGRLTIGQFLKEMEEAEDFQREVLARADQLGEPRWLNEYTAQVHLEISSLRVRDELMRIAAASPKGSPASPAQVAAAAARWPRVFSATGASAASTALVEIKPALGARWAQVSDTARRQALTAARSTAADRALESIRPVPLTDSKTIGDTLAIPEVGESVRLWLNRRPVTRVDFRDDLQVEVALAVDQRDYCSAVRSAVERQKQITLPKDPQVWQRVERDFATRVSAPVIGRASVPEPAAAPSKALRLPERAPDWVDGQIDLLGAARGTGPRLKTSLAAEADARAKLQSRLEALPLERDLTLGQAAQRDPRLAGALQRAVKRARVSKVEYRSDGSVVVHLWSDLRDVWDELRRW